ncbi:MAG: SCP2 sterol-binding domain-containing protein [Pseudomonadales bacterium]|nr:SCP2 sterol-binding domain-containing protein [Pseudomonadales bacterium]
MNAMLSSALTAPIEALLNAVLAQDPAARRQLQALSGKAVSLECRTVLPCTLTLVVEENSLSLRSVYEAEPDAAISATAAALARLATSGGQTDALFSPDIALSGDTHVIQALHRIISGLEIDWEAHFASVFGDVFSHQMGQWARSSHQWSQQAIETLRLDIEEYLHEEAAILPNRHEFAHFSTQVDELKLAVDRAEARLLRLRKALQQQQ